MNSHQPFGLVHFSSLLGIATLLAGGSEKAFPQATPERPRTGLSVWDTGKPAAEPLTPEAIERKSDWKLIAIDEMPGAFAGDAALSNGRLLAVARCASA
jgi:hypothetical protein